MAETIDLVLVKRAGTFAYKGRLFARNGRDGEQIVYAVDTKLAEELLGLDSSPFRVWSATDQAPVQNEQDSQTAEQESLDREARTTLTPAAQAAQAAQNEPSGDAAHDDGEKAEPEQGAVTEPATGEPASAEPADEPASQADDPADAASGADSDKKKGSITITKTTKADPTTDGAVQA